MRNADHLCVTWSRKALESSWYMSFRRPPSVLSLYESRRVVPLTDPGEARLICSVTNFHLQEPFHGTGLRR